MRHYLLAALLIIFLGYWTYKQFQHLDTKPTKQKVKVEYVLDKAKVIDNNLVNRDSWCPDYRRFNKWWASQKCNVLRKVWLNQRSEELLQSYWLDNFNEWEVIARLHNIKTEVLICITYSDTSIWKYKKSTNNIWNVGNNDRGQTVHYSSLLKWIDAIGRVLNNKYLGQYEEVRQLAGSSNPSWPNYATELTNKNRSNNWIINIQNCLSLINDKKIDGWYKIRR